MSSKFTLLFLFSFSGILQASDQPEMQFFGTYKESLTTGKAVIKKHPIEDSEFFEFILATMGLAQNQLEKDVFHDRSTKCVETINPIRARRTHFLHEKKQPEDVDKNEVATNFLSVEEEDIFRWVSADDSRQESLGVIASDKESEDEK